MRDNVKYYRCTERAFFIRSIKKIQSKIQGMGIWKVLSETLLSFMWLKLIMLRFKYLSFPKKIIIK